MLLELYIGILALNFIIFGIAFFRKNVWMWAISLVLSGLLIFASFNIEQTTITTTSQTAVGSTVTYTYEPLTTHNQDWSLFSLTLGMFLLGLALFLNDLFQSFKEQHLGAREF
jgi:phosphatidylserine synthase